MYNLKERDAIKRFLNEETVNTSEAIEILGFTRQYLNQLVKSGELEPMKEKPRDRLFLKEDIWIFKNIEGNERI
ncbi:helix-turn-helix domain-containing protein [Bacillus sp. JK74]